MRSSLFILIVIAASVYARAPIGPTPELKFAWKQIDYQWPSPEVRTCALKTRDYVPENNLPLGLARWKNKLFVTVPKWKIGVASTLNYVDIDGPINQPLKPYPDWDSNLIIDEECKDVKNQSALIVSVLRVFVDSCDRLWVMDTGLSDIEGSDKIYDMLNAGQLTTPCVEISGDPEDVHIQAGVGEPNQVAGPSVMVFDLNTDKLINRYFLKDSDINANSFFANIAVDVDKDKCDDAYAYISDVDGNGLVVYSLKKNDSWRVTHHYFHFDPLAGEYHVGGDEFYWTGGVLTVALSERKENGHKTAFFHSLSSTKEFSVSTALLKNYTLLDKEQNIFHDFKILGERGPNTQSTSSFFHPKTNTLFYAQVNKDGVGCWNAAKPYMPETNPLIMSNSETMEWLNDIKVDDEDYVWLLSDRMPRFFFNKLSPNDINYRILRIKATDAIKGSACA